MPNYFWGRLVVVHLSSIVFYSGAAAVRSGDPVCGCVDRDEIWRDVLRAAPGVVIYGRRDHG
jgi:hypothetical protein